MEEKGIRKEFSNEYTQPSFTRKKSDGEKIPIVNTTQSSTHQAAENISPRGPNPHSLLEEPTFPLTHTVLLKVAKPNPPPHFFPLRNGFSLSDP